MGLLDGILAQGIKINLPGRTWGADGPLRASRHAHSMDDPDPFDIDIDTDELDDEITTTK